MPSRILKFDRKDALSTLRHAIMPAVAGSAVTALEALQEGGLSTEGLWRALVVAVLSGLIRAAQRWLHDFEQDAR